MYITIFINMLDMNLQLNLNLNITAEEQDMMHKLLTSNHVKYIMRTMVNMYANQSVDHPYDLINMIGDATKVIIKQQQTKEFMVSQGQLAIEHAIPTGPKTKLGHVTSFDVMAYMMNFANFKQIYENSINKKGKRMVMASELKQYSAGANVFIPKFIEIIDGDESGYSNFMWEEALPGLGEMIAWCKENRSLWDDITKE